jgi:hypothetical protein
MHTTKTLLVAFLTGMGLLIVLAGVLLTGLSAALASMQGSGAGSCPSTVSSTVGPTGTATPTHAATPSPVSTGTAPVCVPPSGVGTQVVAWAQAMAAALYVNPTCHGQISYPNCYYTWYKTPGTDYPPGAPDFPQAVIQYGEQVCPGCSAWANGTYQCVSFVRGAYSQVYPMTLTANAFALWALYATQPGWVEIPAGASPPDQRGLPQPGDVIVFQDASIGHVAIVMSVVVPTQQHNGSITFSNANSVSPYTTMPLLPDLSVDTSSWPGYTAWGYIRPKMAPTTLHTGGPMRSLPTLAAHLLPFDPFLNKETMVL